MRSGNGNECVDRISDAEHIHIHCYCYHYSFWFSCEYLAHLRRRRKIASFSALLRFIRALPNLNDTWIHQDNPVACTQFYFMDDVVVLVFVVVPLESFRACIFRSIFAWIPIFTSTAAIVSILDNFRLRHFYHLQFVHSWILLRNVCSLAPFRFIFSSFSSSSCFCW